MEKKSSMIRRLIHRDSVPLLSFGHTPSKDKARRKSEGMLTLPEQNTQQNTTPMWYVKEIKTRDAAEYELKNCRVGTFLVRDSETSKIPGSYTLSILTRDKFRHHKIETNPRNNRLIIKGFEDHQFEDLQKLIDFFVKSQKKDIHLIPYNPETEDEEDGRDVTQHASFDQPAYEEMEGSDSLPESMDAYQVMDGDPDPAPALPCRKTSAPQSASYENMTRSRSSPQPPIPSRNNNQSYENIPKKDNRPVPEPPRYNDGPPLPPRPGNPGASSYENIPSRPPPSFPTSHGNVGPQKGYENYFKDAPQLPSRGGHSYQNLPPRVKPRKPISYSAEQNLPARHKPTAPLRRSVTDTESDWQRRGYK